MKKGFFLKGFIFFLFLVWASGAPPTAAYPFMPVFGIPAGVSPRGVGVGPVDPSGKQGLVVANFGSSTFIGQTTPSTLLNPKDSSLQIFFPSANGLHLFQTLPTALSPRGVCLYDLNEKGYQDILVTAYDSNLLQVFTWKKEGFVKTGEAPTSKMPVGVAAGKIRPWGKPFVGVANFGANSISLFKIKDGKLSDKLDIPVPAGPIQLAVGDLNGDGINDLAVACLLVHQIILLSPKSLTPEDDPSSYSVFKTITLPEGSSPSDIRLADLNGDGKTDLVVADFTKNQILVFFQQPDGNLTEPLALPTSGSHPNGLSVSDLSGDGSQEIIVANRDSDSIDIFQEKNRRFNLVQTLRVADEAVTAFGPVELGTIDLTGNGKRSIVATHMRSNTLRVLTQTAGTDSTASLVLRDGVEEGRTFSEKTTLCFPNPSKDGRVKISFNLPAAESVNLVIFNVRGEVIWSQRLSPSQTKPGVNLLSWDGHNQVGETLASGLYLFSVTVGDKTVTKKIAIIH